MLNTLLQFLDTGQALFGTYSITAKSYSFQVMRTRTNDANVLILKNINGVTISDGQHTSFLKQIEFDLITQVATVSGIGFSEIISFAVPPKSEGIPTQNMSGEEKEEDEDDDYFPQ